jgi:hypothetical protein
VLGQTSQQNEQQQKAQQAFKELDFGSGMEWHQLTEVDGERYWVSCDAI